MQKDSIIQKESAIQQTQNQRNTTSSLTSDDGKTGQTFKRLLTTSVFPWGVLSKYMPKWVNITALKIGNLIQAIMLLAWISYGLYTYIFSFKLLSFYSTLYLKTELNCTRYYLFNWTTFNHYIVDLNVSKVPNQEAINDLCLHLPIFYFGLVASWLVYLLMGIGWGYTIDRRYGFLKIIHEQIVADLRKMHIITQLPIILMLIPTNIIGSIIITVVGIRLIILIAIPQYIFKIMIKLVTPQNATCFPKNSKIKRLDRELFIDCNSVSYTHLTLPTKRIV